MMIDALVATVVANNIPIGDPVWLTLIGASSGGKSQLLRPLAKSNPARFIQLDDLTANTFISGHGESQSLLFKIKGTGMILMDDLTVLASKNSEDRSAILSQLRMIYDGRLTKASGKSNGEGITWQGHAGMIAGSTPAVYRIFGESADMGERFTNYRMKAINEDKAVDFVMKSGLSAKQIDESLKELYGRYLSELMPKIKDVHMPLDPATQEAIIEIAKAGTRLRTPVLIDDREHFVAELPVHELPFRVMKQLQNMARAMLVMHHAETGDTALPIDLRTAIEWIGYSLADDKRRAYFRSLIALERQGLKATARNISSYTGLHHTAVERGMSVLSAIRVVKMNEVREGEKHDRTWSITDYRLKEIVKRIDPPPSIEYEDDYKDDEL